MLDLCARSAPADSTQFAWQPAVVPVMVDDVLARQAD
jgi:hypothetical protein